MKTFLASTIAVTCLLVAFAAGHWSGSLSQSASVLPVDSSERLAQQVERLADLLEEQRGATPSPPSVREKVYDISLGEAPSRGPADAPITIIQFGDFECGYCQSAVATIDRIRKAYSSEIRWGFKHHPMPFHRRALPAHKAAMAAHRQGKFWEMHDRLFASQDDFSQTRLLEHAEALGLDREQFQRAMASPQTATQLQQDREEASRLGVRGVPAFFVNGRFVAGAQPFETFERIIEAELAR